MPLLKRLVAGLSLQRPWFVPMSVHVEFVVGNVALDRFFSEFIGFSQSVSFYVAFHTHISSCLWPQFRDSLTPSS
jgi:hypothetical protein